MYPRFPPGAHLGIGQQSTPVCPKFVWVFLAIEKGNAVEQGKKSEMGS